MKKFIFLVAAIGALYYYKPGLFPTFGPSGAFDSKGNPQVLVFTDKECNGPCDRAVQDLRERGIPFQEVSLADSDANRDRYAKLGGNGIIPFLVAGSRTVQGYHKGMFASVLAQTYGDRPLTRAEHIYYGNHFRADGTPVVYMYGASWCGFCKVLRAEMEARHIEFAEVDVEAAPDRAVMEDAMEITGFPVTYVGYERIMGGEKIDQVLAALKTAGKRRI